MPGPDLTDSGSSPNVCLRKLLITSPRLCPSD